MSAARRPAQKPEGLINAGAGFLKWDVYQNKYVWVGKDEIARIMKKRQPPVKRRSAEPSPYEENMVSEMKKMRIQPARRASFKCPGKKGIRQPLGVHNQRAVRATPVEMKPQKPSANHMPSRQPICGKENIITNITSNDCQELQELHNGHKLISNILDTRLLHLRAAHTQWKQQGAGALITYLLKIKMDAVTVDVLPLLTKCVKEDYHPISMGACLDLLPLLKQLLSSKYEDYIVRSLDFIRSVLKKWWSDFSAMSESENSRGMMLRSRSISGVYSSVISMKDVVEKLSSREGRIGERARLVHIFLKQM